MKLSTLEGFMGVGPAMDPGWFPLVPSNPRRENLKRQPMVPSELAKKKQRLTSVGSDNQSLSLLFAINMTFPESTKSKLGR